MENTTENIVTTEIDPGQEKEKKKLVKRRRTKKPKTSLTIEFLGRQDKPEDIVERCMEACRTFYKEPIETFDVYFKPGVMAAYYVVNGVGSDDYKINL